MCFERAWLSLHQMLCARPTGDVESGPMRGAQSVFPFNRGYMYRSADPMYRFKSKADGDLIMMGPVGDQILRIIGREPAAKGIIEVAALPQAIAALEQAIAAAELARVDAAQGGRRRRSAAAPTRIGLQQRAWPLLEMMRRSLAERADIVWGV